MSPTDHADDCQADNPYKAPAARTPKPRLARRRAFVAATIFLLNILFFVAILIIEGANPGMVGRNRLPVFVVAISFPVSLLATIILHSRAERRRP